MDLAWQDPCHTGDFLSPASDMQFESSVYGVPHTIHTKESSHTWGGRVMAQFADEAAVSGLRTQKA